MVGWEVDGASSASDNGPNALAPVSLEACDVVGGGDGPDDGAAAGSAG